MALVRALDPAHLTPGFAALIGQQYDLPDADRLRVLTAASARHPDDFGLHEQLCLLYLNSGRPTADETTPGPLAAALAEARILVALRPTSPDGYRLQGAALRRAGQLDEAIAAYQRAVERTSGGAGRATLKYHIGGVVRQRSGADAALRFFRDEVGRAPADAYAHWNLGRALQADGDPDGALGCFRTAAELGPTEGAFHVSTARALRQKGDLDGAVEAYRLAAARARPRLWSHTHGLSQVLVLQRKYPEAVRTQERMMADFPAVARTAGTGIRFDAACAAVLAGTAGGIDPYPPDAWPALRRKALDWLREDLPRWRSEVALNPGQYRRAVNARLRQMLAEPNLARVRHPFLLAGLPPGEAGEWLAFWAEVRRFRDDTLTPETALPPREDAAAAAGYRPDRDR
jgi:tetratricopeptide (TPR) repeat protein